MNNKYRMFNQKVSDSKNNPLPAKKTVKKVYLGGLRSNKRVKQVVVALSTALVIGITFGFIFLSMVKEEEPQHASTLHSATSDTDEDETRDTTERKVESFQFYVVQAGVFSEKENAEEWGAKFTGLSFPAITWERDGQYFVLTGIGTTEASTKEQVTDMEEHDLEVFVKEWEVTHENGAMNEQDKQFLKNFLTVWNDSVDEEFDKSNWQALIEMSGLSAEIKTFQEAMNEKLNQINETNQIQLLLQMMYEYENLS